MKSLLFFLAFVLTASSQTPASKNTKGFGLSPLEFESVKSMYAKMMETETYIKFHEGIRELNKKSNGVKLVDTSDLLGIKDTVDVKKRLRTLLADDLSKTDFKSPDEAVDMIYANAILMQKLMKENKELYDLLPKASKSQFKEILEPERQRSLGLYQNK